MNHHRKKAASFVFIFFSVVVLLISSITSFSFFYTFFPNMLPAGVLDSQTSRIISGSIGVTLFDLATAVWLFVFLQASETSEQRAISGLMITIAFLGAAMSSVAYLILTATGQLALDPQTQETVGLFSLVIVIIGVVANFGAAQAHGRFSKENKEAVAQADWDEKLEKAHEDNRKALLRQVEAKTKERLGEVAPQLADLKVDRIVKDFLNKEGGDHIKVEPRNRPPVDRGNQTRLDEVDPKDFQQGS